MFTPPFAKIPLKFITINNPETQHEKEHTRMPRNNNIDRYNNLHKAGCRTVSDVAEFEIMRIRAGHEYSLGDL